MATIAFASAAAGTGAGNYAAAVMLGSMIDNLFIMPTLFPADPVDAGRVGEFGVMGAAEGDPVPIVFGQYAKLATEVVWISEDVEEVTHTANAGKNGGITSATYYVNAIVILGYLGNDWSPGTIATLDQVFMDQKRVYANAATTTPITTIEDGLFILTKGSQYVVYFDAVVNPNAVTEFYDKWVVGDKLTWSGWLNAVNNDSADMIVEKRDFLVSDGMFGGYRTVQGFRMQKAKYEEFAGTTNAPTGIAGRDITATGVAGSGWADGLFKGSIASIRDGSQASPWTTYQNEVGSGNASAWVDMAWLPLLKLNLTDFGNRFPNIEAVVSADTTLRDPRGIVGHILLQTGLEAAEYDVSAVDNTATVLGYVVRGPIEATKALQPILLAFDIIPQERGKKIYFFDRADNIANTYTVDADFIGDGSGGGVEIQETPMDQRYGEVVVTFVDFSSETYKKGLERAQYLSENSVANRETPYRWTKLAINLDMTLNPGDAREIAYRVLAHSHADILRLKFMLSPRYLWLQENDRISIVAGGVTYKALISQIDIGANNFLDVQATLDVAVEQDFSSWAT